MTHTKGPWRVDGAPGYDAPVIYGNGRPIAKVLYDDGSEDREVDDNAALIAAAPELFARLRNARHAIASLPDDALGIAMESNGEAGWPIKDELLSYIDAAIAKVEGSQR